MQFPSWIPRHLVGKPSLLAAALLLLHAPATLAVVGGDSIPEDDLAAGGQYEWLVRIGPAEEVRCTGMLVAPSMVLTAAHCAEFVGGTVQVGASITAGVTAVRVHPSWEGEFDFDAALVQLDAPVAVAPVTFAAAPDGLQVNDTLHVAGWGITDGAAAPAAGTMAVDQLSSSLLLAVAAPASACSGDSGGPLLQIVGAEPVLVGIASTSQTTECTSIIAVRVSGIHSWLMAEIGSMDPDNLPPQVLSGTVTTEMGVPVEIPIEFSDPDGTPLDFDDIITSHTFGGELTGCAATTSPTTCTFQPYGGFTGSATFTYTVSDGVHQVRANWVIDVRYPAPPVSISSVEFDEPVKGRQRALIGISLREPAAESIVLSVTAQDGNALNGVDYVARPASVRLRPGQTEAQYAVQILADEVAEPSEVFFVNVDYAIGEAAGSVSSGVTIRGIYENLPPIPVSGTVDVVAGEPFNISLDYVDPDGPAATLEGLESIGWDENLLEVLGCAESSELPLVCEFRSIGNFTGTTTIEYSVFDGYDQATGTWTINVSAP